MNIVFFERHLLNGPFTYYYCVIVQQEYESYLLILFLSHIPIILIALQPPTVLFLSVLKWSYLFLSGIPSKNIVSVFSGRLYSYIEWVNAPAYEMKINVKMRGLAGPCRGQGVCLSRNVTAYDTGGAPSGPQPCRFLSVSWRSLSLICGPIYQLPPPPSFHLYDFFLLF